MWLDVFAFCEHNLMRRNQVGRLWSKVNGRMHVISRPKIRKAIQEFPDAEKWLAAWWARSTKIRWEKLGDVRSDYASVDQVARCLVFNVCGNKYRLIVKVSYANKWLQGTLFVKHFLTHADYDKNAWKKDCC